MGLGFPLQTTERLQLVLHLRRQKFQRDMASKLEVLGLIHHAHATAAEFFNDAAVADGLADEGLRICHFGGY